MKLMDVVFMKKCSHCKREFHDCAVRKCPHPSVNKHFGTDICVYCCMKCKHHIKGGIGIGCDLLKPSLDKYK